jgi:hypothetical protein
MAGGLRTLEERGQGAGQGRGRAAGRSAGAGSIFPLGTDEEPTALAAEDATLTETAPLDNSRALALADFAPTASGPVDAALRWAYRIGVPGALLAAPFRKPAKLRLLATVESPLAGDRAAGMALRAGHFLVHGVRAPIAQMEFGSSARLTPPFARVVHGFSWLRDLSSACSREQGVPAAERVILAWLDANTVRPGIGAAKSSVCSSSIPAAAPPGASRAQASGCSPGWSTRRWCSRARTRRCARACSRRSPRPRAGSTAMSSAPRTGWAR